MNQDISTQRSDIARLLRRLADFIDDFGIQQAMDLIEEGFLRQRRTQSSVVMSKSPLASDPSPESSVMQRSKEDPYVAISKWNLRHEWPTERGLRNLVFNAESNGFDKVIRRVGRRVLIHEGRFMEWVETQGKR